MNTLKNTLPFRILIADDDEDDIQLTRDCFLENKLPVAIQDVGDGQHLMDLLKQKNKNNIIEELPNLIICDLNMPRKDGFTVLEELKSDIEFCKIPVIIFTTSISTKDVKKAYELGANCFVSKPSSVKEWCEKMDQIGKFWIECVNVT